ncbi:sulfite exporter TauE/SafE family protein [Nitrogeniibacter mangrovi]|uniref:Probable membrane transporter protein n=1 Tax=Nitrogeniibacter mangrovi TaxID=2016596 RepID=A0A6C1B5I3_9RHOO|nr:sulfite exporter TauE/SafE family protein [Nitrogeniibacter mangrovi]QID18299.1 sulfite exporter TauE/SafE family protein [Nitrogeniibacter mangrovi]
MPDLLVLPGDLSLPVYSLLIACAAFTSLLTACLGAGGGVMLLAILAQVLPPAVIIPIHGVVQLGSNGGRALMAWRHIDWRTLGAFLPGAVLGALLGSFVLVRLPPAVLYLSIAGFVLYLCWGPNLPRLVLGPVGVAVAGAVTTFMTLFAGATGPLVAAFIKQIHADRFRTVATFAAAMSMQNVLKISVFSHAGFDLWPWMPLWAAMVASGAVGTWFGLHVLRRLPDHHFRLLFNLVLSALALRLIWQALTA